MQIYAYLYSDSYTLKCVSEFKQHGRPFRPAWCTEQWGINGDKSGLSSAAGWNFQTFNVSGEMMKLMVGDVGEEKAVQTAKRKKWKDIRAEYP